MACALAKESMQGAKSHSVFAMEIINPANSMCLHTTRNPAPHLTHPGLQMVVRSKAVSGS